MNDAERWQAVRERNAKCDGEFWYGVITTGVYCKPSCASRLAKRENVRFYPTIAAAQNAGLRPCKRCRPDVADPSAPVLSKLLEICRHIERDPTGTHTLSALSRRAHISQFHLHRLFKAFLHVTPREYVEQVRLAALKRRLRSAPSVTDAIYDSGFESNSAVYGRLDAHLGMTPRKYRLGGRGVDISFAFGDTVLGKVLIGATDVGVCYLQFGDSERELLEQLANEYPQAIVTPSASASSEQFAAWIAALNANIAGKSSRAVPIDVQGTAFQKRVWEFLRNIPPGDVVSYAEVARGVKAPKAVRAAASACASNKIGVLIPCHRVIRGNGELGGYRWGLPRKRYLIDMERSNRSQQRRVK
jgi:AraC family transcriptional regulator, regulatory protein of adaptative response / methylated-DNA-[protein]-cysteine methyltransferase